MRRNFEIRDGIALVVDGAYYDLHNDYRFQGLVRDISADTVVLDWEPLTPAGANLSLRFDNVAIFRATERDVAYPKSEARTLNMIGFAWPDEIENMNSFVPNAGDESYHVVIEFAGGAAIKLFSEVATAKLVPRP